MFFDRHYIERTFPNIKFIWIGLMKGQKYKKLLDFKRLSPNRNLHQNYFGAILFQIQNVCALSYGDVEYTRKGV